MKAVSGLLGRLRECRSGSSAMIVAMGMPMLIGGAGLGVDMSQWYMWKRELQYAVDQAAIAGAWARSKSATEGTYEQRAKQEFSANLSAVKSYATTPKVQLANYAGGTNNSVAVSSSVTRELPFSSFLTGTATTVEAYAQASYQEGKTFTSCLIAVDEHESGAITIGGNSVLTAGCGLAALSDSSSAITVNGNPQIDAGWILARGGIDEWLKDNTDDVILEYMEGLYDPFEHLSPPNPAESQVNRTYTCVKGTKTTRANVKTDTDTTYTYWKGATPETAVQYVNNKGKSKETSTSTALYVIVSNETIDGVTYQTTVSWTKTNNATGDNTTWEKKTTVVKTTQSGTTSSTTPDQATVLPGTYTDIHVGCQTVFGTGVYIIDGGGVKITGQYQVTGSAIMFVLKNGAWIDIAGGANINLTAIQASDLIARGVPTDDANKLAGMLVFEDRNSGGSEKTKINGNANTLLNGTIYLPKSAIDFAGTAGVSSQCLMIAAKTIRLTGTANMTTFCPPGFSEDTTVATTTASVKLVA